MTLLDLRPSKGALAPKELIGKSYAAPATENFNEKLYSNIKK